MSWNNLKDNCSILIEAKAITGRRPTDRKILIHLVADEFPEYPRLRIAYAIDKYMNNMSQPISSSNFISFLQWYLK